MANTVWSLLMKLQGDSSSLRSAVASSEKSLMGMSRNLKSAGKGMQNAGSGMTKAVTLPILGLGGAAIKLASDWESAFAGVKKTLGGDWSQDEITKLGRDIRDMSLEIPIAANELADLGAAGGALGIAKEDMLEFIKTSAILGVTTDLSSQQAADSLGHLNTTMNLSTGEFTKLADAVVYLGNNGASTESQILGMTESLAGTTKLLGFSKQETLGWGAALANTGEEVEAGASSLSRFFMETFKFAAQGGDELKLMAKIAGTSGAEFKRGMETNISGTLEKLLVGMQDLTAAEQLAVMEALGFNDIRITRALSKLIASGDNLSDSLGKAEEGFNGSGAAGKEAAQRFATFESQMILLKSAAIDMGVELGTVLLPIILSDVVPAIRSGIAVVKEWVEWFKGLPPESRKAIVMWAGIAAAMGPVLFIGGKILSVFGSVFGLVGSVARLAGGLKGGGGLLSKLGAQPVFVTNWPPGSMVPGGGAGGVAGGAGKLLTVGNVLKVATGALLAVGGHLLQRESGTQEGQAAGAAGTILGGAIAGSAFGPLGAVAGAGVGAVTAAVTQGFIAAEQVNAGKSRMVEVIEDRTTGATLSELQELRTDLQSQLEKEMGNPLDGILKGVFVNSEIQKQIEATDAKILEATRTDSAARSREAVADAAARGIGNQHLANQVRAVQALDAAEASRVSTTRAINASHHAAVVRGLGDVAQTVRDKSFSANVTIYTQGLRTLGQTGVSGFYSGKIVPYARGSWQTPEGLAMLHDEELVMPKREARAFRSKEFWQRMTARAGDHFTIPVSVQGLMYARSSRELGSDLRRLGESGQLSPRKRIKNDYGQTSWWTDGR